MRIAIGSLVFGVGDSCGVKTSDDNGVKLKSYSVWSHMLERCYSEKSRAKNKTYADCTVSDDWLIYPNFAKWFDCNYMEGLHLDKDILINKNKIYSEDGCRFVPRQVNSLFIGRGASRGTYPQGVSKSGNKFAVYLSIEGTQWCLGRFSTPEEAFKIYKEAKESYVKDTADHYLNKGLIGQDIYNALYAWTITDNQNTKLLGVKS